MKTALMLIALSASAAEAPPELTRAPYWTKTYSLSPFQEIWNATLDVGDLPKALPKVLESIEKSGGKLTLPMRNFAGGPAEQQLSFKLSREQAKTVEKKLKKLGALSAPRILDAPDRPPLPEVKAKIAKLISVKKESAQLKALPVAEEIVDELLEHLLLVENTAERGGAVVLWNMTVRSRK